MNSEHIEQIKQRLKELIANQLDVSVSVEDIGDNTSLYEDGVGLDSISIVNFIVLIESNFNIAFGEDINSKLFSTVNNIAEYIESKKQAAQTA